MVFLWYIERLRARELLHFMLHIMIYCFLKTSVYFINFLITNNINDHNIIIIWFVETSNTMTAEKQCMVVKMMKILSCDLLYYKKWGNDIRTYQIMQRKYVGVSVHIQKLRMILVHTYVYKYIWQFICL